MGKEKRQVGGKKGGGGGNKGRSGGGGGRGGGSGGPAPGGGGLARKGKMGGGNKKPGGKFGNKGKSGGNNNSNNNNNNNSNNNNNAAAVTKALAGALEGTLRLVFTQYPVYDQGNDVLKLCGMQKGVPELSKMASSVDFNTAVFCTTLANVVHNMFPGVQNIDVSDNKISNPTALLRAFRDKGMGNTVRGFNFSNNSIKDVSTLNMLSSFKHLHEISCSGNPMCSSAGNMQFLVKKAPWLKVIDGTDVATRPLSLPWPRPADVTKPEALQALEFVQVVLLNMADNGPDSVSACYHPMATFSLSLVGAAPNIGKAASQNAAKELRDLRQTQEKFEHDLKSNAKSRISAGAAGVVKHMGNLLYRTRSLMCRHQINVDAHVVRMAQGVPQPMTIVTVHGVISWAHRDSPNAVVSNAFDRTFTLLPQLNANGGPPFSIANDMLSLRPMEGNNADTMAVLFSPKNDLFIKKHVEPQTAHSDPAIVLAMVECCSSDADLEAAKAELNNAGPNAMAEAIAAAQGNPPLAIKALRIVGRIGCGVGTALAALKTANGNLDEATNQVAAAAAAAK